MSSEMGSMISRKKNSLGKIMKSDRQNSYYSGGEWSLKEQFFMWQDNVKPNLSIQ